MYGQFTSCVYGVMLLTKRINTFWLEGIGLFWSGGIRTVWCRKSQLKNWQYSQRLFELYKLLMHNFLCQTVPKSSFYILFTYYPNYLLLASSNFVSLPTPTQIFPTFPLISDRPQISAALLGIHTEISVSLYLISALPLNAAIIRVFTIFY